MINLTPEQWAEISNGLKSVAESLRQIAELTKPDLEDKDYEILSRHEYSADWVDIVTNKKVLGAIKSVRRLPDGEVFTIGDMVSRGDVVSPIAKMEVRRGSLMVSFANDLNSGVNIILLKKVPNRVPLFKTEDVKDVFEGDTFSVFKVDGIYQILMFAAENCYPNIYPEAKYFSTRELAEEYVALNKPCLSIADIKLAYTYPHGSPLFEDLFANLKKLAKTKL